MSLEPLSLRSGLVKSKKILFFALEAPGFIEIKIKVDCPFHFDLRCLFSNYKFILKSLHLNHCHPLSGDQSFCDCCWTLLIDPQFLVGPAGFLLPRIIDIEGIHLKEACTVSFTCSHSINLLALLREDCCLFANPKPEQPVQFLGNCPVFKCLAVFLSHKALELRPQLAFQEDLLESWKKIFVLGKIIKNQLKMNSFNLDRSQIMDIVLSILKDQISPSIAIEDL